MPVAFLAIWAQACSCSVSFNQHPQGLFRQASDSVASMHPMNGCYGPQRDAVTHCEWESTSRSTSSKACLRLAESCHGYKVSHSRGGKRKRWTLSGLLVSSLPYVQVGAAVIPCVGQTRQEEALTPAPKLCCGRWISACRGSPRRNY